MYFWSFHSGAKKMQITRVKCKALYDFAECQMSDSKFDDWLKQYSILESTRVKFFSCNKYVEPLEDPRSMQTTIYADGITNLTMLEGVVRFDLINITHTTAETRTEKTVGSVAMSVPALLRTYTELSSVLNKLIEQGVVKKTETPQPTATAHAPITTATSADAVVIEPLRLS
jgi:hypothetical protein